MNFPRSRFGANPRTCMVQALAEANDNYERKRS